MLRNIAKLTRIPKGLIAFKPQALPNFTLTFNPVNHFSSDQPPKGFEKFQRRRSKPSEPTEKPKKEEKPKEQRVDPEEESEEIPEPKRQSQSAEDKKSKIRWEKSQEPEEKTKKKETKPREEEEHIENEEEVDTDKKKDKKPESPFEFKFNFNLGGDEKSGGNKGSDPKNNPKLTTRHYLILSAVAAIFGATFLEYYMETNSISYVDFVKKYLEEEKINKIVIRRISDGSSYRTVAVIHTVGDGEKTLMLGNVDNFLENLEKSQLERGKTADRFIPIEFDYKADTNKMIDNMMSFIYLATTIAIFFYVFKQLKSGLGGMGKGGGGGPDIFGVGKSQVKIYGLENKIKTRFKDVAGLDEAKVEIMEFVEFLKKPKRFKEIGAKIPRGALLAGPPGTGKTLLAKAAAGEAGVPFLYISGSDFVEMFVGVGASRVRDLFKKAKENAPSIIFIDEIDAVGRKRESKMGGNDERDNTLNQLLVEMDGFGTENNVVVLAATNRKELLDPALTRPGRFDRSIEVTLPDIGGRKEIFLVHLKPLKLDPSKTLDDYARRLATLTPGFSGADIHNLCNEAAILAARRNKKMVSTEEFEAASERVIAGLEKKKIVSEEERRTVAVHESGHAVVSWFLEGGAPLLKLTIIPRSKGSLGFAQYLPNESSLETKEELMDRISCVLGGRCSEELFNGRVTTGAYDDLRKAYDIAHAMITKFGMSEKIGFLGFADEEYFRKHSDHTAKEIDNEIKAIIDQCTEKARKTVREHKDHIQNLSAALLERETLDLQAIIEILGERPYEPKSNYKAYLEYKKEKEEEEKEIKEHERKEKEEEGHSAKGGVKKEGEGGENQEEGPEGVKGGGGIEERGFGHQGEIERKKEAELNKKIKDDRADLNN